MPDGVPRPSALPFGQGPNRTDLAQLPGTPGTELPQGVDPSVGSVGGARRALADIPLQKFAADAGGLKGPSERPNEPGTAGIDMGAGPGSESVLQQPDQLSDRFAADELEMVYPVLMRLSSMPHATTQSKILAQRMRVNLSVKPEQVRRPQAGFPPPPPTPEIPEEATGGTTG